MRQELSCGTYSSYWNSARREVWWKPIPFHLYGRGDAQFRFQLHTKKAIVRCMHRQFRDHHRVHKSVVRWELKALNLKKPTGNFPFTKVVAYEATSISLLDCKPHSSLIADISSGDIDISSFCSLLFFELLVSFPLEAPRSPPGPQPLQYDFAWLLRNKNSTCSLLQ